MTIWFPHWWCARAYTVVLVVVTLIISVGFYWFLAPFVFADVVSDEMMPEFAIPGYAQGQAMTFSVDDSGYHDITVTSDVLIDATVLSMPGMIEMSFKRVTSPSTSLTITNLAPNHEYQMYLDGYENHSTFITDNTGAFSFSFDLTEPRYVIIQEHTSTIFLQNDTIGGDCELIGIWNDTDNICTMTRNATDTVQFSSDGITLDGGGFTLAGPDSGNGIFIANRSDVTVRNIVIENFSNAIRLSNGAGQRFENITVQNSRYGINANNTQDTLVDNSIFDTTFTIGVWFTSMSNANVVDSMFVNNSGVYALHIIDSSSTFVRDNTFTPITQNAISHIDSTDSILRRNTMIGAGILFDGETDMHHQNDIDTSNTVDGRAVLYLQDEQNVVFNNTENASQIFCSFCENVTLQNFSPAPYYTGIYLWDMRDSVVTGNTLTGNAFGVTFLNSGDNEVMRNSFSDNSNDINIASGAASENNVIYRNNFLEPKSPVRIRVANTNSPIFKSLSDGGNYWSEYDEPGEGCNDNDNNGICDQSFNLGLPGGITLIDEYPWVGESVWDTFAPVALGLGQFKILGIDSVDEGDEFIGNIAVFGATLGDPQNRQVQLEVEVKPVDIPFNGSSTLVSDLVPSGATTSVTVEELIPKDLHYQPGGNRESFHWRARAINEDGLMSAWQEFGVPGNTDFSVRVVPLVTQVRSDFPPRLLADEWADRDYAMGKGNIGSTEDCGLRIEQCACLLSSIIMTANYYGEFNDVDDNRMTPLTFDTWMNANDGYDPEGNLSWNKELEYLSAITGTATNTEGEVVDVKEKRFSRVYENRSGPSSEVTEALDNLEPVVVMNNRYAHWFVLDSVIRNKNDNILTYAINDPAWYNTKRLNDPGPASTTTRINTYNNVFNRAVVYQHHPELLAYTGDVSFQLGSPAELLITDSQGRRLGRDPVTDTDYNEIPDATYVEEFRIQTSEIPIDTSELTTRKIANLPNAEAGEYAIQVIGTGDGPYDLSSIVHDRNGNSHVEILLGTTSINQIDAYEFIFTPALASTSAFVEPNEEETFEELIEELKDIVEETKTFPRFLKLQMKGMVYVTEYFYHHGKIKLAQKTIKKLKKLVKKKKGKGIPKEAAQEIIVITNKLLVLLKK